jgi:hypothetical protein
LRFCADDGPQRTGARRDVEQRDWRASVDDARCPDGRVGPGSWSDGKDPGHRDRHAAAEKDDVPQRNASTRIAGVISQIARIQVSVRGGFGPVWRDDGRELYYEGPQGLMAVPMTERDGALEAGTPQALFAIHTQGDVINQPHDFEVAAHGQKFLVYTIVDDSDNAPLEVTLNWTAGLTK